MARTVEPAERGIVSPSERRKGGVATTLWISRAILLVALGVSGVLPILWLAKSSITPTLDTISNPLALFPSGIVEWGNLAEAWQTGRIGAFLLNTVGIAGGTVVLTLVVSLTAAYVASVLRPRWAPVFMGAILATLLIPSVVLLVPLYLTVLSLPPAGINLLNTYWAIWLPASANAVAVVIVRRFFDGIPRELFDAARVDGAGPFRVFISIVLPLSRPVIGVVAVLTAVSSWKDFLWPLIVISDGSKQPISVALAQSAQVTAFDLQLAGMFLALLVPVTLFVVFQRTFLRGVSASSGVKG